MQTLPKHGNGIAIPLVSALVSYVSHSLAGPVNITSPANSLMAPNSGIQTVCEMLMHLFPYKERRGASGKV